MRRMTRRVAAAFMAGQPLNISPSLWTSGGAIYSYATAIAVKHGNKGRNVILNGTRYTNTTSRIQKELRELFPKARVVAGSEIFTKLPSRAGRRGDFTPDPELTAQHERNVARLNANDNVIA